MKISLTASGLLDPRQLDAWSNERQKAIRAAVKSGMQAGGKELEAKARAQMQSALKISKTSFVKSMRAKVFDKKPERLPALYVGSKVPWLGLHEKGGRIGGPLLIPINVKGRIGYKRWKAIVRRLIAGGNAFFKQVKGKVILFAENQPEFDNSLARHKRTLRGAMGGGKIKRGAEIPIAVLVQGVNIRKRLDLEGTVNANLGSLARAIQQALNH